MFTVHYCNFTLHHIGLKDSFAEVSFERNSERVKEIRHQYVQVKHVFYVYSNVQHFKLFYFV